MAHCRQSTVLPRASGGTERIDRHRRLGQIILTVEDMSGSDAIHAFYLSSDWVPGLIPIPLGMQKRAIVIGPCPDIGHVFATGRPNTDTGWVRLHANDDGSSEAPG